HTRFSRDWSSDVCSSDLAKLSSLREPMMIVIICGVIALQVTVFKSTLSSVLIILVLFYRAMGYIMNLQSTWNSYLGSIGALENRSEERRVGKEYGARRER